MSPHSSCSFRALVVVAVFAFNDAPISGAAVARFHTRLVSGRRWRAHRPLCRRPAAEECGHQRHRCRVGDAAGGNGRHGERVPARARTVPRQVGAVAADAGPAGDSRRYSRHLDPGVREPSRAVRRRRMGCRARFPAARVAARGRGPVLYIVDRTPPSRRGSNGSMPRSRRRHSTSARRAPRYCGP